MSKYIDLTAVAQVIGCVFNDNSILDAPDEFPIFEEDFTEEVHKIIFGSMYNIHEAKSAITLDTIVDYLAVRPKYEAVFKANGGLEYVTKAAELATRDTFKYYYSRLKKFTLLRAYDKFGVDVSFLYDTNNILDLKKKQKQEDWLDSTSLVEIADIIDKRIYDIKVKYIDNNVIGGYQAGEGILELIENFKKNPEVGAPLYGRLVNTVTRGARLRKLYLRSAATGAGKTRALIADACNFACNKIYDTNFGMWIKNGASLPTLFIGTEQDKEEIQTMMLAFLSAVNEDHILRGEYKAGEEERVIEAGKILSESPIWVELLPDYSLMDVENTVKRNIREHDIAYVCFDYIQSTMKILEEVTRRSGGVRLREDNILFMLSVRLKDICNEYGIFLITATQLSGDFRNTDTPDQSLLRGAKSLADKVDIGEIILDVTEEDLETLKPILSTNNFQIPDKKISVYKNRRGSYKGVYLWCASDLGICRIQPQFVTKWNYDLVPIEDIKIIMEDEPSAF